MDDKRQNDGASESLRVLTREIEKTSNDEDRQISECMAVVLSALEVGADVDRLVERTGYPRDLIERISVRMRTAELWIGKLLNPAYYS